MSFGISSYPSNNIKTVSELIDQTDTALYKAKEIGRNCVIHADDINQ